MWSKNSSHHLEKKYFYCQCHYYGDGRGKRWGGGKGEEAGRGREGVKVGGVLAFFVFM